MSEMIERVTRAILAELERQHVYIHTDIDGSDGLDHVIVDGAADMLKVGAAALAAMREPTEAVLDAAERLPYSACDERGIWSAMIDAALKTA